MDTCATRRIETNAAYRYAPADLDHYSKSVEITTLGLVYQVATKEPIR